MSGGLQRHEWPVRDFLARAAARIVDVEGVPRLRETVILVPDFHAVGDVAQALRAAARTPVLLLPRITTLRAWADEMPDDRPVFGDAARAATLYSALSGRAWFDGADLWSVCGELARLFDDLTRERVRLAAGPAEFAAWLREAYGAQGGAPLDFEARLVHDTWSAFAADAATLDRESAYVARLARLAARAQAPLHVLAPATSSRAEREFYDEYAKRARLHVHVPALEVQPDAAAQVLIEAWPAADEAEPLRARAARLRAATPTSPLAGRVRLAAATSAEHEAQIVDYAVREALVAGRSRIAVVVQDRITARRARALLERADVLVSEEAGWAMSTMSAATVIARWLDAVAGNFYHRDVLDLLKSPYVFADWPRAQRQQAVWRLEQMIRADNVVAGLDRYLALADAAADAELRQMLGTLRLAAAPLQRNRGGLAQWLTLLLESLETLGVPAAWRADAAGAQLLELLERLREELRGATLMVRAGEWRQWLSAQLDNAAFRDDSVTSPVVFTYLGGLALRRFDTVIVVGADAAHLPGSDATSPFFNQGVRAQLGLPTRRDLVRETERRLAHAIAGCDDVVITWQCMRDGEPNLLSPLVERLDALHRLAYEAGPGDGGLAARAVGARVRTATAELPEPATSPAPRVPPALVPQAVSASAHNALMACPYQFYVRYVLRLSEADEVQELIEKSGYGLCVHDALARFHRTHPRVSALAPAEAVAELERASDEAFAGALALNYLARAWRERWRRLIPDYVDWQCRREAEGWRFAEGEAARESTLTTPAGRTLRLRGRIDRVDHDATGQVALVDYKTQRRDVLQAKAQPDGEDVQLPFYALLWGEPAAAALFVGLERDGVKPVPLAEDVNRLAGAVRERLGVLFDHLYDAAPLPAHGVERVCTYCEAAGLCRRSHWP